MTATEPYVTAGRRAGWEQGRHHTGPPIPGQEVALLPKHSERLGESRLISGELGGLPRAWAAASGHQQRLHRKRNLHLKLTLQATDGSVFAVEAVLQVNPGLTNEVVRPNQVMVVDQHGEQGLLCV